MNSAVAVIFSATLALGSLGAARPEAAVLARIEVDYPESHAVFPPEISPPTFLFRDALAKAEAWLVEVTFDDGSSAIRVRAAGERLKIGEIDPRCVSDTNQPPKLTPQQAA